MSTGSGALRQHRHGGRSRSSSIRRRMAVAGGVALASVAVVIGSAPSVGAATDAVTNCLSGGTGSLPAVVAAAPPGATITFAASCPAGAPITLNQAIDLTKNVTISGPGPTALGVSGADKTDLFDVPA